MRNEANKVKAQSNILKRHRDEMKMLDEGERQHLRDWSKKVHEPQKHVFELLAGEALTRKDSLQKEIAEVEAIHTRKVKLNVYTETVRIAV